MEAAETTSAKEFQTQTRESRSRASAPSANGKAVRIEPDLDFIRLLQRQGGDSLKKCFQCGTCSATCELSPESRPFPRKEMAWAVWGMKDRLLKDPDIWLCHQCNDCSTRCPRGARPGDVLAAVRQECVVDHAFPRFLGRWTTQPQCIPLLLGIPAALLATALGLKEPIERALDLSPPGDGKVIYAYTDMLPHWLLNGFFGLFSVLVLAVIAASVVRFWRGMEAADAGRGLVTPAKGLLPSIAAAIGSIVTHGQFASCTRTRWRFWSHACVFFGFVALSLVTIWVITARVNPLVHDGFVYPLGLWSPWKMLANTGGAALVAGCLWMAWDRLRDRDQTSTYSDWALLVMLLAVAVTGFAAEALHYVRLEPQRFLAYFAHLVFVLGLLLYLPYSKLAHLVYRTTAMVYAEYSGRGGNSRPATTGERKNVEK